MLTLHFFARSDAGRALAPHGFHPAVSGRTVIFRHADGRQIWATESGEVDGPDANGRTIGDAPLRLSEPVCLWSPGARAGVFTDFPTLTACIEAL